MAMGQCRHRYLRYLRDTKGAAVKLLNVDTIPPILKTCAGVKDLRQGISFHAAVVKKGFEFYTSISNSIMSFYIKCDMLASALNMFRCMASRDSVSWNVVVHGFLDHGAHNDGLRSFVHGRSFGFKPNVSTLVLVFQACWKVEAYEMGSCLHGLVTRGGYCGELPIQNSLLCMYARFCDVKCAEILFEEMDLRDVITWSSMLSLYVRNGEAVTALGLFKEMMSLGGRCIDGFAVVGVLQACGVFGNIKQCRILHGHVVIRAFEADVFVGNSLVDMYLKCSDIDSAYMMFYEMPEKNLVTWNTLLSGLIQEERFADAVDTFQTMKESRIAVDDVTIVSLLQLAKLLGQPMWCKCFHGVIVRRSGMPNLLMANTILDAYAKCGLAGLSTKLFDRMEKKNLISWSTMISGYGHCGMPYEAISMFAEMILAKEKPNAATILSIVEACSLSACLKLAKSAHGVVFRNSLTNKLEICTSLLDMYGKCGELSLSRKVFDEMPDKNVVTWSAMIGTYGMNGRAREAVALFHKMQSESIKPNKITMLSVLTACSHGGLVEEGLSCFRSMLADHSIEPNEEHYSCVVDLLGRAGDLNGAMELVRKMPKGVEVSASAWGALLSAACRRHGDAEIVRQAASHVIELEPLSSSGYLLASSLLKAGDGSREERARMRLTMREKGVKVVSGHSLVHVQQKTHMFLARDVSHPNSRDIYLMIQQLHGCMKLETKNHYCPFDPPDSSMNFDNLS